MTARPTKIRSPPDGHPDLLRLSPFGRYMSEMITSAFSIPLRRAVLLGLAAGLSVAAAMAIVAILTHSFDQTDARLIATSYVAVIDR